MSFLASTWRLFALIFAGVIPFIILAAFVGWLDIIKIALFGFFVALLTTVPHGARVGLTFAALFSAFAIAGAWVGSSPWGAAVVVGLSAVVIPVSAIKGTLRAGIFAAMFIPNTFNPAPMPWHGESASSLAFLGAVALVTFLGGLVGLVIGNYIHKQLPPVADVSKFQPRVAFALGSIIVIVTFVLTYYSMTHFPQAKWAWLLATIYSMMLATTGMSWRTSRDLILGTIIGIGVAIGILFIGIPISVMVLLGTFVMCASIAMKMLGRPNWMATSVSTGGVILLTGANMDPFLAAEDRFVFTVVGAIIAVALGFLMTFVASLMRRNGEPLAFGDATEAPSK